uniref:Saposin B-type domain-containing protein n=1 Tax=Parastrongyloides trichosuri TaxID=131310 RepID=A0A0N4Z3X7_PARTI
MKLSFATCIFIGLLFNYAKGAIILKNESITVDCAHCLLLSKIFALKEDTSKVFKKDICTTSGLCTSNNINDCQILSILEKNNNFINIKLKSSKSLKKYLKNAKVSCETNTNTEVFTFKKYDATNSTTPSYGLCVECELVSTILKIFNDALFGGPVENAVRNALMAVCQQLGAFINNFCEFLFSDNGVDILFRSLRDSLGSFYQIIGVDGMGCPLFKDLESKCFSPL